MNVRKFYASTSRQALYQVRHSLGPDALILSNRAVDGGVEILAMGKDELPALTAPAQTLARERPSKPVVREPEFSAGVEASGAPVGLTASIASALATTFSSNKVATRKSSGSEPQSPTLNEGRNLVAADDSPVYERQLLNAGERKKEGNKVAGQEPPVYERAFPAAGNGGKGGMHKVPSLEAPVSEGKRPQSMQIVEDAGAGSAATAFNLASEIKSMRGLIEEQLVFKAWDTAQQRDPGKAKVLSDMLRAGFSPALARQLLGKMPSGLELRQKVNWVKSVLDRNLLTVSGADEIVERGGVYALVGPTGVGKTTTVAKIAARCVVRYGADRLALLTTDSYRIGAHEQLRIYGKLLGVRVLAIKDASDLQFVLEELRGKHLVLIDTVGMSQRDQMVAEQLALLSPAGIEVRRLLLLNAAGNGETLDDVVRVYRGGGVHGCIITKTDEAVGVATALDVGIRHRLPLHYVTNGQRVPEDLHLPDKAYLLDRALRPVKTPSAHHLEAAECQLMVATASSGFNAEGACLA